MFRAEKHSTPRHLNEYTSLDFEMGFIRSFQDVMDMEAGFLQYAMALLVGPQRFTLKATRRKGGFFYECGIFGKRVSSKLSSGPPL